MTMLILLSISFSILFVTFIMKVIKGFEVRMDELTCVNNKGINTELKRIKDIDFDSEYVRYKKLNH